MDPAVVIGLTNDGWPVLVSLDGIIGPARPSMVEILDFRALPIGEAIRAATDVYLSSIDQASRMGS